MKTVLVAVLHWGLGHATRCIPIIKMLEEQGARVLVASDGAALALLQLEFPHLLTLKLPAYDIHYKSENMFLNILDQSKKIFKTIKKEQKQLESIIREHNIDIVISDNRFGCYHKKILSIFVTHQINIKTPYKWSDYIVRKINHFWIKKFDAVWVPDVEHEPSLAGSLSHGHNDQLPPLYYLGVLSRMTRQATSIKPYIAIVLSGPEPQRSFLEQKILTQVKDLPFHFILIRGLLDNKSPLLHQYDNIEVYDFLASRELNKIIGDAMLVISRSGYTTLMDLALTGKKALLIPTPGQTEQEYLAEQLHQKSVFYTCAQKELNLAEDLPKALKMSDWEVVFDNNLEKIVKNLLK